MKKTISMMLAVVLCMGLFTGCGDKSPKPPKEVTEIVEGVNKDVMENRQTSKESFQLTDNFESENTIYYVYESNGVYDKTGKECKTTLKFICKDGILQEVSAQRSGDEGLNIFTFINYMDKNSNFKSNSATTITTLKDNKIVYVRK